MTTRGDEDWPDGLQDALRRRAERAPALSPLEASRRVRDRIRPRARRRQRLGLAAAAALVVLALAIAFDQLGGGSRRPARVEPAVVEPLPDNVVLFWLDPETPVYFVVGPPTTQGGGPS